MSAASAGSPIAPSAAGTSTSQKFDARRGEIISAALAVIERDGLHAASVRAIAHEMGCTTGVISHHFRTKDDLTALACDEVTKAIARRVSAVEATESPRNQLGQVALAVLPDDPDSTRAWTVWIHFLGAALQDDALMGRHSAATTAVRAHIADLLTECKNHGAVGPTLDAEFEAAYLYAVIEGLGTHGFISPDVYGPHSFGGFVTEHIERVLAAHPPLAATAKSKD